MLESEITTFFSIELSSHPNHLRGLKIIQAESIIGRYIRVINSEKNIIWNKSHEIIRRIFTFYQSGYRFSSFDESFFY
jgi:hypothetical protein